MSIKTVGGMKEILNNYDAEKWIKSADFERKTALSLKENPEISDKASTSSQTFAEFLSDSMIKVNNLQSEANEAVQKLASGESKNIHETLLKVEQADIAFRGMNQIRLKVLDAYKEVMRMQV